MLNNASVLCVLFASNGNFKRKATIANEAELIAGAADSGNNERRELLLLHKTVFIANTITRRSNIITLLKLQYDGVEKVANNRRKRFF